MSQVKNLVISSEFKITQLIYKIKHLRGEQEKKPLRTPEIEATIIRLKNLEKYLITNRRSLVQGMADEKLMDALQLSGDYKNNQASKRAKRQTWRGLSKEQRDNRNQNLVRSWQKSKLSLHNFAKKQSKKYGLSVSQIKNILKNTK